ncbi:hypothetical protein BDR04DRAFT_1154539 [Suillus decipiens]|nr:hypothetical protein BDR04DRAFT_1154539 [Suillus decipiens]
MSDTRESYVQPMETNLCDRSGRQGIPGTSDTSFGGRSPFQRSEEDVWSAALSPDGKVLVTGCQYENAYTWDAYSILKEARLEDLLKPLSDLSVQKSLMNSSVTRRPNIQARRVPPAFFDGVQNGTQSSTARGSRLPVVVLIIAVLP